jgi:hypothetical protein
MRETVRTRMFFVFGESSSSYFAMRSWTFLPGVATEDRMVM